MYKKLQALPSSGLARNSFWRGNHFHKLSQIALKPALFEKRLHRSSWPANSVKPLAGPTRGRWKRHIVLGPGTMKQRTLNLF